MHGLKVMNQYSGSAKNKLACATFEVSDQPVRQYHTCMCSQQHNIVSGGGGGGGGLRLESDSADTHIDLNLLYYSNEHSCYALIA